MTDEGQTVVPLFGAQMRFRLTFSIAAAAAHVERFVVEERASKACARGRGRWHACRRCRKRNLTWGRRASDVKVAPRNMARVVGVGVGRYLNNYRWENKCQSSSKLDRVSRSHHEQSGFTEPFATVSSSAHDMTQLAKRPTDRDRPAKNVLNVNLASLFSGGRAPSVVERVSFRKQTFQRRHFVRSPLKFNAHLQLPISIVSHCDVTPVAISLRSKKRRQHPSLLRRSRVHRVKRGILELNAA